MTGPRTLFQKIWDAHVVAEEPGAPAILYVDRHLVHEVTSPQAFTGLRARGLKVRRADLTFATADHSVPTKGPVVDEEARKQLEMLEANATEFGVSVQIRGSPKQGVVHIIGPEQGLTLPGMTIVCGDSHTSTHGAFGALAFGIGTSEVEHVLASQCLLQNKAKTFEVKVVGTLGRGVTAKDLILGLLARIGVGGGGLISGVAAAIKASRPGVRVVGVEAEVLPCLKAALAQGGPVTLDPATTLADGIAVKRAGDLTFEHVRAHVDELVTVSEEEIASAILYCLEKEKTVTEGAGAVGVAALMHRKVRGLDGRRVVTVVSGGNIDVNLIARIIERGLVKDGRLVRVSIALMDKPGQLAVTSGIIAGCRANVIEVHHTRAFASRVGGTTLQLTLETRGPEHVEEILAALRQVGYAVEQIGA